MGWPDISPHVSVPHLLFKSLDSALPVLKTCHVLSHFLHPELSQRRLLEQALERDHDSILTCLAFPSSTPESLDNVFVSSSETPTQASAPVWPPLKEEADNTLPGHSIPVPATELGSTELVTTKTAGPEQ